MNNLTRPQISNDTFNTTEELQIFNRNEETAKIQNALNDPEVSNIIISGVAGVGKTTIIKDLLKGEYVPLYKKRKVVELDCKIYNTLPLIIEKIAQELDLETKERSHSLIRKTVFDRLKSSSNLLILDNYEYVSQDDEILSFIARLPKSTKAVIITRTPVQITGQDITIRLDALPIRGVHQILKQHLNPEQFKQIDEKSLEIIYRATGGLPLAVILIAELLKSSKSLSIAIKELNRLEISKSEVVEHFFSRIENKLSSNQRRFLTALSFFAQPTKGIAISKVSGIKNWRSVSEALLRKSIITKVGERFTIHPLLRSYISQKSSKSEKLKLNNLIVKYFTSIVEKFKYDFDHLNEDWLNIQQSVENALINKCWNEFVDLLSNIQDFIEAKGYSDTYESWINKGLDISPDIKDFSIKARLYFLFGMHFLTKEDFIRADEAFIKSLEFRNKSGDKGELAETFEQLGRIHLALKDFIQSEKYLKEALFEYRKKNASIKEINILINLGQVSGRLLKFEEADNYLNQALNSSKNLNLKVFEGFALKRKGEIYLRTDRSDKARTSFRESLDIWRETGNNVMEALVLKDLASMSNKLNQIDEAKNYIVNALRATQGLGESPLRIIILRDAALINYKIGAFDESRNLLETALKISSDIDDKESIGLILGELGLLSAGQNQWDLAKNYLHQALEIFGRNGEVKYSLETITALCKIAAKLNQYEEAENLSNQALKISEELDNQSSKGRIFLELADIYSDQNTFLKNPDKSLNLYKKALKSITKENDLNEFISINNKIGNIYLLKGQENDTKYFEQALQYYNKALELALSNDKKLLQGKSHCGLGNVFLESYSKQIQKSSEINLLNQANFHFREALKILDPIKDVYEWTDALGCLITINKTQKDWSEGKRLIIELIKRYHETKLLPEALPSIEQFYTMLSDWAKDENDFEFATKILAEIAYQYEINQQAVPDGIQKRLCSLKNELGNDHFILICAEVHGNLSPSLAHTLQEARQLMNEEQHEVAVEKLSIALKTLEQTCAPHNIGRQKATISFLKGYSLRKLGFWTEAVQYQQQAFKLFEAIKDYIGEARALLEIGFLYELMNNYEDSRLYYIDAYRLYKKAGSKDGMATVSENLGRLEYRVRLLPQAIENLSEAHRLYISLGEKNKASALEADLENAKADLLNIFNKQN